MKTFSILLLTAMLTIVVKKSDEKYLLVEIDHEEAIEINPGIECCDYYNVLPSCFPSCKQLEFPINNTEDSSNGMKCKDFSGVINKCRNGRKKIEKLKHLETNPGIECCDNYNVDPKCFLLCKQLDNPVNNTEESSGDMTCEDFSGVINKCRNGSSGWKLDKCCKKYDVPNRCQPALCWGYCKNKPWTIIGNVTGDEECDKYVDDVSRCCGPN